MSSEQPVNPKTAETGRRQGKPLPGESKNPIRRRLLWVLGVAALLVIGYGLLRSNIAQKQPADDLFALLQQQGYEANIGFSGTYAPGNIIQIKGKGADGREHPLNPPLVVLWRDQCFPGKTLKKSLYVLPESSGKQTAQLTLGAELLGRMLPALQLDSAIAADFHMKFAGTHVLSFAKLDLSQQFSAQCVQALQADLLLGNAIEWYAVVLEAIAADSIDFTIDWRENVSVAVRTTFKEKAEKALVAMIDQDKGAAGQVPKGSVSLAADSTKTTVIKAAGLVIVGYRYRPLQPVYDE
jgi:hypothetical protein